MVTGTKNVVYLKKFATKVLHQAGSLGYLSLAWLDIGIWLQTLKGEVSL